LPKKNKVVLSAGRRKYGIGLIREEDRENTPTGASRSCTRGKGISRGEMLRPITSRRIPPAQKSPPRGSKEKTVFSKD